MYAYFRQGKLLVPLPFLPKTVDLGTSLSFWPAAIISIAICAAVGLLLYVVVFRPLRAAPPVAKAVVALVEQHVALALEVADRAMVLVHGQVSLDRTAAELRADTALLEAAYFGDGPKPRDER